MLLQLNKARTDVFCIQKIQARRSLVSADHYGGNQEATFSTLKLYHYILFLRILTAGDYIDYHNHKD